MKECSPNGTWTQRQVWEEGTEVGLSQREDALC